ncbi:MAG: nondiscriminating glutamyl-tRNA synthetase [Actinomycetota bacterium]|nr:nondiscriminating glutamyl-tRNA synthetase [Actinomycetota bacterium]
MVVRTRIAPAPSGSIHVGNARTALYNWLYARQHKGVFVLRVEDTDQSRVTEEAYQAVLEDLRWLGLGWDEGPEVGGPHAPYRQSERMDRYATAIDQLLQQGDAYLCYCTPEELAERRKTAQAERRAPGYDGRCRDLTDEERAQFEAQGRSSSVRFRVPEGRTITVDDVIRGSFSTETAQIPDFVIRRSDGSPTYMLAVTVDDVDMDITHVIRGEDLMAATPRQLLMREALGVQEVPVFGHLPLLVDEKGRPLSKRWGDVSVAAYREQGFLPEALVNYLALLGWSFDDHTNIFSVDELVEKFTLERVGKNPAAFDVNKLEWLNGHYIKQKSPEEMADLLVKVCARARLNVDSPESRAKLIAVAPLITERMKRLTEAPPMIQFLFEDVAPDDKAAKVLAGQEGYLREVADRLEALEKWNSPAIEEALRGLAEERGLKPKQAFQPVRAAVTGTLVSPPLFESLEILGRPKTLERLRRAAS